MKTIYPYVCVIALTAAISGSHTERKGARVGNEESRASVRYRDVYRISRPLGTSDSTPYEVGFRVVSRLNHVRAKDISVVIQDGAKVTPLVLDEFGQFQLPMAKRLYRENPQLVFNQPEGTLTLECCVRNVRIRIPDGRALTYRELVGIAIEPMTLAMLLNEYNGRSYPHELYFDLGREVAGSVTIQGAGKAEQIALQSHLGRLRVPLSERLLQINPIVTFPEGIDYVKVVESCGMPVYWVIGRIPEI